MPLQNVKIGAEFTAPDTAEHTIRIVPANVMLLSKPTGVMFIAVTSGTIQFSVGEAITAEHKAYAGTTETPAKVLPLPFVQELIEVRFKAASNTDKFIVTAI